MKIREKLLKLLLKECPDGDITAFQQDSRYKISCNFVFYGRYDLMENILFCLDSQDFPKEDFEIILVEDRGGSDKGKCLLEKFPNMNITYLAPKEGWGKMGFMRNWGLSRAKGETILFLDDDTVITDQAFLTKLHRHMTSSEKPDAVMPCGNASWSLIKGRYSFHDPYFYTNRCMAYKRQCLISLRGFNSKFTGQEDVELAIRFLYKGFKSVKSQNLSYYHPPLVCNDLSKAYAVGNSFAESNYSAFFKFFLLLNGSRWIFLFLMPGMKNKHMARFACGFFKGFLLTALKKNKPVEYK